VFVGVSIHLSGRRLDSGVRLLGLESVANLLYPVLVALVMLVPVGPTAQGVCLLVLSAIGLPGVVYIAWQRTRPPRAEPGPVLVYRYVLPLLAMAVGTAAAVGLMIGWTLAAYGPALFVFLMFIVGTQNAWDLLLGSRSQLGLLAAQARLT